MMMVEAKLAPQFTSFDSEIMASLETQLIFADQEGRHDDAFSLDVALMENQFSLSQGAALKVVSVGRPIKYLPPILENLTSQFQEISRQTGLGTVDEKLVGVKAGDELTADTLAQIWSQVYGVDQKVLMPAMQSRIAAFKCLERNVPSVAVSYVEDNLRSYYAQLKQAIS